MISKNKEMIKLSAVIITFNEEKNIGRCIESILDIVDEIVVVDSFSEDRTKEICLNYGVNFYQIKWQGYSESKNLANSKATNDWILSLDADEALSDKLKKSILNIKKEGANACYSFNRLTNYCGTWVKFGGWYPDTKTRIFNRKDVSWTGLIHETLTSSKKLKTIQLDGDCLHYSYYTVQEHILQTKKFSPIAAEMLFQKGKKATFIKRFLSPISKFLRDYFIKLGFLHGYKGFQICIISGYATYIKYKKLKELDSIKRN